MLSANKHGWDIECFKHDLYHALAIGLGVQGCLGQEDWVLLRTNTQLVEEHVIPEFFHVVPVVNHAELDGVTDFKNVTIGYSFITDSDIIRTKASLALDFVGKEWMSK